MTQAAMFIDLRGYTLTSRGMRSPDIYAELQSFYRAVHAQCLQREGLRFVKVMGDEALYVGNPNAAVSSAKGILKSGWDVDIGIATGRMRSFDDVGPPGYERFDVLGEAVNLAARLETVSEHHLVIDDTTYESLPRISHLLRCFERVPVDLKGYDIGFAWGYVPAD